MKIKAIVIVWLIIANMTACTSAVKIGPRADNFTFVFQDFSCGSIPMYVLDTTGNTLVYTPLGDTTSIAIAFALSDDELEAIYQKAVSIGFFAYPSEFVVPEDQMLGYQQPASSYSLSMTNGEMTNSVSWTDNIMTKPSYIKADQLRELMYLVDEIIQSHPEVQQLPGPKAQCA